MKNTSYQAYTSIGSYEQYWEQTNMSQIMLSWVELYYNLLCPIKCGQTIIHACNSSKLDMIDVGQWSDGTKAIAYKVYSKPELCFLQTPAFYCASTLSVVV